MKIKDLRGQSEKDLQQKLYDNEQRLRELRLAIASNQWKNVREVRLVRKTIAKIKTVLQEQVKKTQ